jgi:hypothetical protein
MQLVITPGGVVRCLYTEEFALEALGRLTITRASYVEPDAQGRWHVDLSPVAGPRLGPFTRRSEALQAEERWLEEHRLE